MMLNVDFSLEFSALGGGALFRDFRCRLLFLVGGDWFLVWRY